MHEPHGHPVCVWVNRRALARPATPPRHRVPHTAAGHAMISLEGLVVSTRGGQRGGTAVAPPPASALPKKPAQQLSQLEEAFRNFGVAGCRLTRTDEGVDMRVVFRNNTQGALLLDATHRPGPARFALAGCAYTTASGGAPAASGGMAEHVGSASFAEDGTCLSCIVGGHLQLHGPLDADAAKAGKGVGGHAVSGVRVGADTRQVLAGRVYHVLAEHPNKLMLVRCDPANPQLETVGAFRGVAEQRVKRVYAMQWGPSEDTVRVWCTSERQPAAPASPPATDEGSPSLTVSGRSTPATPATSGGNANAQPVPALVITLSIAGLRAISQETDEYVVPGAVSAVGGSTDGGVWAVGCLNGVLHIRDTRARKAATRREAPGQVAACIHVSSCLVVVGHTTPSLTVYDHALTPVRTLVHGVSEGIGLDLRQVFGVDASCVAAVTTCASTPAGPEDVLGVVLRGGPVGVFKMQGTLTTQQRLKHTDTMDSAVVLVHMAPPRQRVALLSQLLCKVYARRDHASLDRVLAEFKDADLDKRAFAQLFKRYFIDLVHRGDVLNAYRVARDINEPAWFDEIYLSSLGTLDTSMLELCLAHASQELRTEVKRLKACGRATCKDEYSVAAMEQLLAQIDAGDTLETPTAVLLIKLVTFHRSFAEGQALLARLIEKAERDVRDEVARELKGHRADAALLPIYAD